MVTLAVQKLNAGSVAAPDLMLASNARRAKAMMLHVVKLAAEFPHVCFLI
jgi:hypothetical protein